MNKLARAITKWTKSCDKRLARLTSYIHHTSEYRQYCYVGKHSTTMQTRIVSTSDFAGNLEDSRSTSGGIPCIFGSHAFGPISWMCKKQTSVSFSSTEAESISLDACLRMDGIRALNLWDLVIEVVRSAPNKTDVPKEEPRGARGTPERCEYNSQTVANYARKFPRGHWSFLGLASEKK